MRVSISALVTALVLGMTASSLYSFWNMFEEPQCGSLDLQHCLTYFLKSRPDIQLAVFSSDLRNPSDFGARQLVITLNPFDYERSFDRDVNITLPKLTMKTKNLFLHVFLLSSDLAIKEWNDVKKSRFLVWTSIPMLKYKIPSATTVELLRERTGPRDVSPVWHIKKSVAFTVIVDMKEIPLIETPQELQHFVEYYKGMQLPIMHYNVLHERLSDLTRVDSNKTATIKLHYNPYTVGQFRLMIHFEEAFNGLYEYGFSDKDIDQMKGLISGTHFYLLIATIVISTLHLIFDFLALKSDVVFWKDRSSLTGISPRTVLWRAISQTIILVYLFDETTSYLVLVPASVTTGVEWWKVGKLWRRTSNETITEELDAQGMKYLYYLCIPLCLSGAWYSLMYIPHKSWYSWIVQSLANGVYAFGFLLMLPQLFINYKLKSVDHMPWKKFMYKALNTFIDDLFAFLIEMPATHRLACLRDDLVFFVYLYQRYLYPVDKKRTTEESEVTESVQKNEEVAIERTEIDTVQPL